jgi:hypothetical protein
LDEVVFNDPDADLDGEDGAQPEVQS